LPWILLVAVGLVALVSSVALLPGLLRIFTLLTVVQKVTVVLLALIKVGILVIGIIVVGILIIGAGLVVLLLETTAGWVALSLVGLIAGVAAAVPTGVDSA